MPSAASAICPEPERTEFWTPTAGRERQLVLKQLLAEVTRARAGTDPHQAVSDDDRAQRSHVDDDPARRRVPGQAMAAAPRCRVGTVAASARDDLGDVLGSRAAHDRLRLDLVEAGDERLAHPLVRLRSGQYDIARDPLLQSPPVGFRECHRATARVRPRPRSGLLEDELVPVGVAAHRLLPPRLILQGPIELHPPRRELLAILLEVSRAQHKPLERPGWHRLEPRDQRQRRRSSLRGYLYPPDPGIESSSRLRTNPN